MIPRRPRLWWGFGLGSAALLAALGWASVAVYRLEGRNAESRAQSQRQEVIRRALWRVDSQLAPIIAMEAARPAYPVNVPQARERSEGINTDDDGQPEHAAFMRGAPVPRLTQLPAGLLQNAFADGFFVVDPTGAVRATDAGTERIALELVERRSETTAGAVGNVDTAGRDGSGGVSSPPASESAVIAADVDGGPPADSEGSLSDASTYDFAARQQVANIAKQSEYQSRPRRSAGSPAGSADAASEPLAAKRAAADKAEALRDRTSTEPLAETGSASEVFATIDAGTQGQLDTLWVPAARADTDGDEADIAPELVLVRTIETEAGPRSQGVRLDWAALRAMLEDSVDDLLPEATLIPARGAPAVALERGGRAYRLATIPALLVPGQSASLRADGMTPAFWALLVTWIATLLALVAVASVLHATLRLSDRRARFVGAVTHELRTPLTTFRLYAQMLAGGMVTDEHARAEYLSTLERESVRLGEIVENVLEYARLTVPATGRCAPAGRAFDPPQRADLRLRPVLSRRAEQSGMDLIVSIDRSAEADSPKTATCDPRSVERILMNLVENACKYAGPAPEDDPDDDADTRIHLDVQTTDRVLEILTSDHGPGVPARQRERIFGEFQRGPGAAESSRPGLGLGLALSRGLAREMGGDLRLVRRRGHGAEFLLTVPLDPDPGTN